MTVTTNLRGTSELNFRIGLTGPTIYVGSDDPSVTTPTAIDFLSEGDFYLRQGGDGTPSVYNGAVWNNIVTFAGGTDDLEIPGQGLFSDGSAATPSVSFTDDNNTGFYRPANNQIAVSSGGASVLTFTGTGIESVGSVTRLGNGTSADPTYSFSTDTDTGMYRHGPESIGFSAAGIEQLVIRDPGATGASVTISGGDALGLPNGNTTQRPTVPLPGMIRHNTDLTVIETFVGGSWETLITATSGASTFVQSANNLSDLSNITTAITNLGLSTGGTNDIWVKRAGDTMTGDLDMAAGTISNPLNPTAGNHIGDRDYNDVRYIFRAGDTMTGNLIMGGTSTVRSSAGTAALPAFTFDGDANTGIYNTAANRIGLSTAGVLQFEVTNEDVIVRAGSDLYMSNNAIIFSDALGSGVDHSVGVNVDHIWHNDTTNTWNFVSDAAYKSNGNANLAGQSSSALYADLAERYEADDVYPEGTLLIIGGNKEVTTTDQSMHPAIAGLVSTKPAFMMNNPEDKQSPLWPFIALAGRVPCRVIGTISKGDRIGSSSVHGVATSLESTSIIPGSVVGIAMEDYDSDAEGVIEVMVRSA